MEWCKAGMVGGMCRVRDVCCGGEDAEKVEESAVERRERRERRIFGRFRRCIIAPGWPMAGEGLVELYVSYRVRLGVSEGRRHSAVACTRPPP